MIAERNERRDALDQRLIDVLAECGLLAIPVPNRPERVAELWNAVRPQGVVLSGGNDLSHYGGSSLERDKTESILLELALAEHLPVLGICRGFQMLVHYLGGKLHRLNGHTGTRHQVNGLVGNQRFDSDVNSYHDWGIAELGEILQPLAHAADGSVEAAGHHGHRVLGIMWHPEREPSLSGLDRKLIEQQFV
ncbi:gamma-glutamyl-gamma-aminobutyrate hydrolase family protein [Chitinibacter tainanensis]|uniref:gamma-glutamyl-gamma-aminobutyrate hydrolase family protein n=1 Tax=Chitinibacter tainanensis TaxID=230667 RepID=UPI001FE16366|nr:gamma-glutamyl-gamma-aminobutyrate hydrolase family protein [Chitinibacter tainanensis]